MKTLFLSFFLLFCLFGMAHASSTFLETTSGYVKGVCGQVVGKVMGVFRSQDELKSDIVNKFAQYGHTLGEMKNSLMVDDDVYHKGLTNLAVALKMGGKMPLTRHSRPITDIVIADKGRGVTIWDWENVFSSRSLTVHVSAYTPIEEIVPKMSVALLEHEIGWKLRVHGQKLLSFNKGSGVNNERFVSFLETFLKALEDGHDVARIADFPDHLVLNVIDGKTRADFRKVVYGGFGFNILVSADTPAESLFRRLSNAFLERQVTRWLRKHYSYQRKRSAIINDGVDDAAYERGLKFTLAWLNSRDPNDTPLKPLLNLDRIYVTDEEEVDVSFGVVNDKIIYDIHMPSNMPEADSEWFNQFLPAAE